jgi:esterase/lipase superfamily enzyme
MHKEIHGWHSPSLDKQMDIAVYGTYGFAVLLVPTAAADFLEYERFQLIDSLKYLINSGKIKVFSINSINRESWMNNDMHPPHKAIRHNQFNQYVYNEVIPFIKDKTSQETPIYISGASFGALHSMNLFLKRPDLLNGVIAMSGCYDLSDYTKGYYDNEVFFNSPEQYVPGLSEDWYLENIRKSNHIHIMTGQGNYEDPSASRRFSQILRDKGIGHDLDVWGHDMPHDWQTWRAMLPYILEKKF